MVCLSHDPSSETSIMPCDWQYRLPVLDILKVLRLDLYSVFYQHSFLAYNLYLLVHMLQE